MIEFRKESDEVLYSDTLSAVIGAEEIIVLKRMALLNRRKRIRLCTHDSPNSKLHEMFIVHTSDCYVRPHKHIGKDESISVIEGCADVVFFNDDGSIHKAVSISDDSNTGSYYCRIPDSIYHMLIIRTDFFIFHECTQGPFNSNDTIFPKWAPLNDSFKKVDFIKNVEANIGVYYG